MVPDCINPFYTLRNDNVIPHARTLKSLQVRNVSSWDSLQMETLGVWIWLLQWSSEALHSFIHSFIHSFRIFLLLLFKSTTFKRRSRLQH